MNVGVPFVITSTYPGDDINIQRSVRLSAELGIVYSFMCAPAKSKKNKKLTF